ncbi:MAG: hypothetical protein Q9M22_06295 [Mariprofundaceae bacterium]|nr:hypothetical protein [Mariprofundaceae bacterium]
MAYKLSERKMQHLQHLRRMGNAADDEDAIDWGKVATVCMIAGVLSLLTAWVYSFETEKTLDVRLVPNANLKAAISGPIHVVKYNESYTITVTASMAVKSWSFIEGQVLDQNKNYLFSFGKDLWDEQGRDSDGYWREINNSYAITVTFPTPGNYYIRLETEYNRAPKNISIRVSKQLGSSIPHFWLGIFLLLAGIVLNEFQNQTISRTFNKIEWD